ncbi:hypothetical protein EVAR_49273_1 [Eumeta japonica]|uniref:Uncharacterized protein n=1 Tax=Eumeta variegata TaxID=151549 RepID=A0A4C1YFF1_EUMVA|nr:hypothetical protein EVAR_49273_1 [Eumeta japonica]
MFSARPSISQARLLRSRCVSAPAFSKSKRACKPPESRWSQPDTRDPRVTSALPTSWSGMLSDGGVRKYGPRRSKRTSSPPAESPPWRLRPPDEVSPNPFNLPVLRLSALPAVLLLYMPLIDFLLNSTDGTEATALQ